MIGLPKEYLASWETSTLVVLMQELHLAAGEAMCDGTSPHDIEDILQSADTVEAELSRRSGILLR